MERGDYLEQISEEQIEKLRNPNSTFKLFIPTEAKLKELAIHLMNEELYIPDEKRNWPSIYALLNYYLSPMHTHIFYEIGDFQGLIGFMEVYPEYKAFLLWKMWDKSVWNKTFARHGKEVINLIMDTYKLKRLGTETADPTVVKMARMAGFVYEGAKENEFMWNGKMYSRHVLAKYGE